MPEKKTIEKAKKDKKEGKAPSTQAGEFVHEEIEHVREGKHGARNTKQAIAIGLSKARRAGVDLPSPQRGSKKTKQSAARARKAGQSAGAKKTSRKRSAAISKALKREGRGAASRKALSRQARGAAKRRKAA